MLYKNYSLKMCKRYPVVSFEIRLNGQLQDIADGKNLREALRNAKSAVDFYIGVDDRKEIKLLSYEIAGPKRIQILFSDGHSTNVTQGNEVFRSDFVTEYKFLANGKYYLLRSALEYDPRVGTCSVARIVKL